MHESIFRHSLFIKCVSIVHNVEKTRVFALSLLFALSNKLLRSAISVWSTPAHRDG